MKFKLIGLAILSSMLMVGCEEASSENEKISDEYVESAFASLNEETSTKLPEDVKNGTVSEDMYLETLRFATEFTEYEQKMFSFQSKLNNDSSLYDDGSFIAEYKESMNSYEVFIKGFHLSPSTVADFEIDSNLSDTILYTSYIISALRQYVDTGEKYHLNSLEEHSNKRNTSYTALTNTIKKYELDVEN